MMWFFHILRLLLNHRAGRSGFGIAVLGGVTAFAQATPVEAQTLWEAMARAYQEHPALSAQRARVRALDADVDSARGGWRPTVFASTSTGRFVNSSTYRMVSDPIKNHHTASDLKISASQPLLNWSAEPAINAAQARLWQGGADLLKAEQAVLLDAASAYLNVLQYRRLLALNEANARSLARQVEYRHANFQRRLGTRTELAQAKARYAGARAQLDRIKAELEIAESAFLRHVGIAPGELSFPVHLLPLPDNLDQILATAADKAPDVRSAYYGVEAARADVERAKGQLKPTLSLEVAGAWHRDPSESIRRQQDASIQLSLRIPLYQAGVQRAQVQGSAQRAIQQQDQWRNARLQARYEASDAWRRLRAARAESEAFSAAITASKVAFEGVSAERAVLGEPSLIEVLNAEQELFQFEVSLIQARTQEVLAHLQLLASLGQLTAQSLALPVVGFPRSDGQVG